MPPIDPANYVLSNVSHVPSPGLLFFADLLEHNLQAMLAIAGSPSRLCPHVKTHKTCEITRKWLQHGVERHKCATLVEAELLAREKVPHVLVAYQMIGPNLDRLRQLMDQYPTTRFAVLVDSTTAIDALADAVADSKQPVGAYVDLNTGMDRTGIEPDERGRMLVEALAEHPRIQFDGLHWYDGQHRQADPDERQGEVLAGWDRLCRFRDSLLLEGLSVPRVVAAGSGSFAILADLDEPDLVLSPGTTVLYDADLAERFPELPFQPAVGLLTRVISNNRPGHITLDLGHKACCADQPSGRRLHFPTMADAVEVQQTEEHLVLRSIDADRLNLGDTLVAIPRHACTTVAAHESAWIIRDGQPIDRWPIAARHRL